VINGSRTSPDHRLVVTTPQGAVAGQREGEVLSFRGIRYAQAPVGFLRWRPPQPVPPWRGVFPAQAFPPIAPQAVDAERMARPGFAMSEDCLALNIWAPATGPSATGRAACPVLVFIHGGGMTSGHGAAWPTRGALLASRDVIVVTFNYRLGGLGTLFCPERLGAGSVNLALQDIVAALQWVRAGIAAFGGDPGNITAIGQSSGAVALSCVLAMELPQQPFDRAVLQSGGLARVLSPREARRTTQRFFAALGPVADAKLRSLGVPDILAAQAAVMRDVQLIPPSGDFHPTIDGAVLPGHPLSLARAGGTARVPLLIGTTDNEWGYFDAAIPEDAFTDAMVYERARALVGRASDAQAILAAYRLNMERRGEPVTNRALAAAMVSDFHFRAPAEQLARANAGHGNPTFHYEISWPLGAAVHGDCLPLLFGTHPAASEDTDAARMSRLVQDAWVAFARSGNPSTAALGSWPSYRTDDRATMILAPEPGAVRDHRRAEMALWDQRVVRKKKEPPRGTAALP